MNNKNIFLKWAGEYSNENEEKLENLNSSSKKTLTWRCKFNHKWKSSLYQRIYQGKTCPSCKQRETIISKNGSFGINHPELVTSWDKELNEDISPYELTPRSLFKAWWKCDKGHESYQCTIANRGNEKSCPQCAREGFIGSRIRKRLSEGKAISKTHIHLLSEWDYEKNKDISPEQMLPGSDVRVWWNCKQGHSWKTSIKHRALRNTSCPLCSNQTSKIDVRIYTEVKSLFTDSEIRKKFGKYELDLYIPSLKLGIEFDGKFFHEKRLEQDVNKNNLFKRKGIAIGRIRERGLKRISVLDQFIDNYIDEFFIVECALSIISKFASPQEIKNIEFYTSQRKFNSDDEYKSIISALPNPLIGHSFIENFPELAMEWHPKKNGDLLPENVYKSSSDRVWWKCENNHEYEMTVNKRANGRNCPYCSNQRVSIENSLSSKKPWLIDEFHPTKNGEITPDTLAPSSNKLIWWICKEGHVWQSRPSKRKSKDSKSGTCKICKSFGFTYPELAKEFDQDENGFSAFDVTVSSGKKVWWKCKNGHSYQRVVRLQPKVSKRCIECSNYENSLGVHLNLS